VSVLGVCAMAGSSAQVVLSTVEGIQSEYNKLIVREVFIQMYCKLACEADFIVTERVEVMFVVCLNLYMGREWLGYVLFCSCVY
jgi:hypothetical protein